MSSSAGRAKPMLRALSTAAPRTSRTNLVPGMPVDTSGHTVTGGSGADATQLSPTLQDASRNAVGAYRSALRDIPAMRENFSIMEDKQFITQVIRDNFERHRNISDPKVIDMLVFKAAQELREIREQWKSRHHVYRYIQRYSEKMLREELAQRASSVEAHDRREQLLQSWRDRGIVPAELVSWPVFERWRADEDAKFRTFAIEKKLFSAEELDRNAKQGSTCNIM